MKRTGSVQALHTAGNLFGSPKDMESIFNQSLPYATAGSKNPECAGAPEPFPGRRIQDDRNQGSPSHHEINMQPAGYAGRSGNYGRLFQGAYGAAA